MVKRLFHFQLDKNTLVGLISGSLMVILSCAMTNYPNSNLATFVLRDILMIFLLGFLYPLYYVWFCEKGSLAALGIHTDKWKKSLIIDIIAAMLLLIMFIGKNTAPITFSINTLFAIAYIFSAGIFEMIFIYGFLRYKFEQSFGIIPAIILTAIFYSLHHAGFQPEFAKLFFVGVLYSSVFYLTKNLLIIFPFFWGVGAVWDVLINSNAGNRITNAQSFVVSIILLVAMAISVCVFLTKKAKRNK